jgi:hypothetical protein
MKAFRRILYLAQKDIKDAIRDARVLVALIIPLGIGIFYGLLFDDDSASTIHASIAISSQGQTNLINQINRLLPANVTLTVNEYPDQAAVEDRIANEEEDVGLVIPPKFDAQLAAGDSPSLTVVARESRSIGADYILTTLDPALRSMAGQDFPVTVNLVTPPAVASSNITDQVGLRTWSILLSIVMSCCLVSILAIPIVLVEEVEKKTLDALVLAMDYWEVVAAKTLLGLSYTTVMTAILLALTRIDVLRWGLLVVTVILMSVALLGVGLLLAGLFRSANQLNTWSGLTLTPLLVPALAIGPPVPDLIFGIAKLFPTGAGMSLLVDSVSDPKIIGQTALLLGVLVAWIAMTYAALVIRLNRTQI